MVLGLKIDWKLIRQRIKSWYARQSFFYVHGLNPERHKMRGIEGLSNPVKMELSDKIINQMWEET